MDSEVTQVLPHLDPGRLDWITNRAFTEVMQGALGQKRDPLPVGLLESNRAWAEQMKELRHSQLRERLPSALTEG